jgi:hypothetical protein
MCKFYSIGNLMRIPSHYLYYVSKIQKCYRRYFKYLQDDFNNANKIDIKNFIKEKSP